MDYKKLDTLYALLERAKNEKDTESVAALKWAIFTLDNLY